jgi:hypothetical protein
MFISGPKTETRCLLVNAASAREACDRQRQRQLELELLELLLLLLQHGPLHWRRARFLLYSVLSAWMQASGERLIDNVSLTLRLVPYDGE